MLPYRMRHADKEGEEARAKARNAELLSGMVLTPEERAVRKRAVESATEDSMRDLSAALRPADRDEEPSEVPADLSAIFGPAPGSQDY